MFRYLNVPVIAIHFTGTPPQPLPVHPEQSAPVSCTLCLFLMTPILAAPWDKHQGWSQQPWARPCRVPIERVVLGKVDP